MGWDGDRSVASGTEADPDPARRPNIILIVTDDQTPLDSVQTMPFLSSRPGGHWVEFTNAYLHNPLCCPSRANLLTGLYSHHNGVMTNGDGAKLEESSTVATWLQAAGYRTGFTGKYLNRYPWDRGPYVPTGWDDWFAIDGEESYFNYTMNDNGTLVSYGNAESDYLTDVMAGRAESFIRSSTGPFFLYFAPFAPHAPVTPAPRHRTLSIPVTRSPNFNEEDVSDKPQWIQEKPYLTETQAAARDREREKAFRTLRAVDDAIQRMYQTLQDQGVLDNTVIVFMTDNGFMFGEHRHQGTGCVYEECLRTPLLVRYPWSQSRIEPRLVQSVDLAPTFARLAGVFPPTPVDGISTVPLLEDTATGWRDRLLFRFRGSSNPVFWAMRNERWKYAELESTGERELYDLLNDPHELENLAGLPEYADLLAQLAADLDALKRQEPVLLRPLLTVDDVAAPEGDSGETPVTFTLSLSEPSPDTVTVAYSTEDGSATAGSDYLAASGTLAFSPGELSRSVSVQVLGDTLGEEDETFFLVLSDPVNVKLDRSRATGTILNDDSQVAVAIDDVSVVEGDVGSTTATFTVSLPFPAAETVTVNYATEEGTASAGSDFTATTGTVTFDPGETSKAVAVTVLGDTMFEDDETFIVRLSGSSVPLSDDQGLGTILDDDPVPSAVIDDRSLLEGNSGFTVFTFTVSLSAPTGVVSTVAFTTRDGTAVAPEDYVATSGTLTFQPGEQAKTIDVLVVGDTIKESHEGFTVLLSDPTNMQLADSRGAGTIRNDDGK